MGTTLNKCKEQEEEWSRIYRIEKEIRKIKKKENVKVSIIRKFGV